MCCTYPDRTTKCYLNHSIIATPQQHLTLNQHLSSNTLTFKGLISAFGVQFNAQHHKSSPSSLRCFLVWPGLNHTNWLSNEWSKPTASSFFDTANIKLSFPLETNAFFFFFVFRIITSDICFSINKIFHIWSDRGLAQEALPTEGSSKRGR